MITFDDGYEDAATAALPILERYGFPATFYIVTEFVGRPGYLSWEQVALLHASGMEIGSHSLTHPDLAALDLDAAEAQIVQSKAILEQQLGIPIRSFCYPIGSYSPEVADLVRAAGYTNAVTTHQGRNLEQMFEIPRRRVLGGETLAALAWYLSEPTFD